MGKLYKDRVNNKDYHSEAEIFWKNINDGNSLRECLQLPEILNPNEKAKKELLHTTCDDTPRDSDVNNEQGNDKEKRICRCFYYRNKNNINGKCKKEDCRIKYYSKHYELNNCNIIDYEIPVKYKTNDIGNFDLLIEFDKKYYAVEVKPPKPEKNREEESIFRMILEILTYDYCNCYDKNDPNKYDHITMAYINNLTNKILNKGKGIHYKLGIAFFESSKQHEQFKTHINETDEIIKILNYYKITVFLISEYKDGYKIDKIYN